MIEALYQTLEKVGYTHPVHPPFTHMPTGLLVGALIFGLISFLFRRPVFAVSARHCFVMALIFFFPTAFFGYTDWVHHYDGIWTFPVKIKLVLTGILALLLVIGIYLNYKRSPSMKSVLTIYFLAVLVVAGLGYYGGNLVFGSEKPVATEELNAGEKLYAANCGTCHPQGGNILNHALPVKNSTYLKTFKTFLVFNRKPQRPDGTKGLMPAIPPEKVSDAEMKQIYNYITHSIEGR
ncbi:MAG: c-type cytochrome [Deltaproteobacteria bacterium]|nr:c-type cytochrome [Deltaproteobacteria bacterium]